MSNGVRQLGLSSPADLAQAASLVPRSDPLTERQRSFAGILSRANQHPGAAALSPERQARETAEQFVAMSFVQPLLKQLRDTNGAAAPFAPSKGEKQMQSMLDGVLAEKLVSSQRWPLVDRIADDMLKKAQASAAPKDLADLQKPLGAELE